MNFKRTIKTVTGQTKRDRKTITNLNEQIAAETRHRDWVIQHGGGCEGQREEIYRCTNRIVDLENQIAELKK